MIKSELITYLNKYHLSGMVESVVWNVNKGICQIKFISQENSIVGELLFPFIEIGEGFTEEIGIFNTSVLLKLLSIMHDDITLSFDQEHGIWMKLNVTDGIYEGSYSLADIRSMPDAPDVDEPKTFEVDFVLDKEFKDQYLKAYKALGSINRFTIQTTKKDIKITLGNKESYANKVSFNKECDNFLPLKATSFSGEAMAEILKNNPELNESTVQISEEGLMKITIYGSGSDRVIYYLIELEEV